VIYEKRDRNSRILRLLYALCWNARSEVHTIPDRGGGTERTVLRFIDSGHNSSRPPQRPALYSVVNRRGAPLLTGVMASFIRPHILLPAPSASIFA
jgi:hypothetical protein